MHSKDYNLHDTIFAPITSILGGAVCVFRISGARSFEFIKSTDRLITTEISVLFAQIIDEESILDESLITVFHAPKSFTGENILEISIHASEYIYKRLIEIFTQKYNFRFANNGEFLYRALVNSKIDLTKAEGVNSLIQSATQSQHKLAIRGVDGTTLAKYEIWHNTLVETLSLLEANIDFSDQDISNEIMLDISSKISSIKGDMDKVLHSGSLMNNVVNGFKIAILGLPNAGKSSLINALTKSEIAIISPIPGTTRDLITAQLNINGYLVNIVDTAGIRSDVSNDIEREGIVRAKSAAKSADLRLFLFEKGKIDNNLLSELYCQGDVLIASKADLITGVIDESLLAISVNNLSGLSSLIDKISSHIIKNNNAINDLICTSERQLLIIKKCFDIIKNIDLTGEIEILAEDVRFTLVSLGEIFGSTSVDDILGNIFSKFCIGK